MQTPLLAPSPSLPIVQALSWNQSTHFSTILQTPTTFSPVLPFCPPWAVPFNAHQQTPITPLCMFVCSQYSVPPRCFFRLRCGAYGTFLLWHNLKCRYVLAAGTQLKPSECKTPAPLPARKHSMATKPSLKTKARHTGVPSDTIRPSPISAPISIPFLSATRDSNTNFQLPASIIKR